MRLIRTLAMAAAALLTVAAGPPQRGNWVATVNVTPRGSHVMGNPAATYKLTEYISYTCSHCAQFDREASDPMRIYFVMPGKLSVEVRHLVRDPIDMTVAMLTNCGAPSKFFLNHAAFLRSQDRWIAIASSATPGQQSRWTSGSTASRFKAIASDFGFYAIMEGRGYDRPATDRCLGDEAMARRLAAQTEEATKLGIDSTPSFLLNGELLAGTHDWRALQLQLKARS